MNKKKYRNKYYSVKPIYNIKEMVNSCAANYGNKPAFFVKSDPSCQYEPISHAKMKRDVDSLGTSMLNMGFKDRRIAVIGENSYWWVISYFATVSGVGTVVPIDRELKEKEMAGLLDTAKVSVVFTSEKLASRVEAVVRELDHIEAVVVMERRKQKAFNFIDKNGASLSQYKIEELVYDGRRAMEAGLLDFVNAEINNEEVCTILFSSGTTGMAKGIMLSHRNITANIVNMSKYVKVSTEDRGLSILPMHHAYEMTCHIMTGLYQGVGIAICDGLKYIQKNLVEIEATIMIAVPLIFETIYKKMWNTAKAQGSEEKLKTMIEFSKKLKLYNKPKVVRKIFEPLHNSLGGKMRVLIAGGAAINPKVIEDFEAMGFPMFQGYGMTENAPIIAVNRDRYSRADAAGFPMPETEVRIINPNEEGVGEIVCRGPSVMVGYLDNPEATEETIINGWLHTGDLGYMDKEGFLYIAGRLKSVIVTKNGKNIFPEEVEFYLSKSPYISEVLVHGQEDEKTGDVVVKAEVYPNFEQIKKDKGDASKDVTRDLIKQEIDSINEEMPLYKRVRRFGIREVDFEKTTTRKIKRHVQSNYQSE